MSVDVGPPEGSFPDETQTKQKQDYDNIILLKTHKYTQQIFRKSVCISSVWKTKISLVELICASRLLL